MSPETPLERRVCADPEWRAGVEWGAPRSGHPEGAVIWHIRDVLGNVERAAIDADDRARLRLAAIVHDAFKSSIDQSRAKVGENDHAVLARHFAARYVDDAALLDVLEFHDDAYRAWRHGMRTGDWDEATRRAQALIERLGGALGLYLRFYDADNQVPGKTRDHYDWFSGLAEPDRETR